MSEHVLCMVLYLIELGLDNQVQDTKADEVRYVHSLWPIFCALIFTLQTLALFFQEPCIEEHCHDSWFPGTNLLSNLHHIINFVRVRVPETAPEVKKEAPPSTSSEASSYGQVMCSSVVLKLVTVFKNIDSWFNLICSEVLKNENRVVVFQDVGSPLVVCEFTEGCSVVEISFHFCHLHSPFYHF